MATTTASANSFHNRSVSFPPKSHPILLQVQHCLRLVRSWESSPVKRSQLATGLSHLKELYNSVNAFLQLTATQKSLSGKESFVKALLDDFLCLLDACESAKMSLLRMREQFQSICSMIRRGGADLESGLAAYRCTKKRMKREMSKCFRLLKSMENRAISSELGSFDTLDHVFREVRTAALSVFTVLNSVILCRKDGRTILSRLRQLGSKYHTDEDDVSEIQNADVTMFRLCNKGGSAQDGQKQIEALDSVLRSIEIELEDIFRCLLQTRVSLLNIVTGCLVFGLLLDP